MTVNHNQGHPRQSFEGFTKVESKVPGIVVYAPESKTREKAQTTLYNCPNCGAATAYDVAAGGIACEHCGYISPVNTKALGRVADEFEFTLETVSQANRGWGIKRQVLHCDACGAELSQPEGAISTSCPFCASNQVNLTISQEKFLQPRFLIPFKITLDQSRELARTWLGNT